LDEMDFEDMYRSDVEDDRGIGRGEDKLGF
jgi:hypothetical protein